MVKKILPIREVLYQDYKLLFLFDNTTSHLIYASNGLQDAYINKRLESQ